MKKRVRKQKTSLYDPFIKFEFNDKKCFLCGNQLNSANRTDEHIFPQWLLSKYSLHNGALTLPNGTTIKYRQVHIPSCLKCNNVHLSRLENRVSGAVEIGHSKFLKLPNKLLFLWLLKIFYELVYLDMRLLVDRSDSSKGPILDPRHLIFYRACHTHLLALKHSLRFKPPAPWSLFIFKIKKYDEEPLNFDYYDDIEHGSISIRIGDVGIMCALFDYGHTADVIGKEFSDIARHALHPLQFAELTARVFYSASIFQLHPSYAVGHDFIMPIFGLSGKKPFDEWKPSEYAKYVSHCCKFPYEDVFSPPSYVWSCLYDESGNVKDIPLHEQQ